MIWASRLWQSWLNGREPCHENSSKSLPVPSARTASRYMSGIVQSKASLMLPSLVFFPGSRLFGKNKLNIPKPSVVLFYLVFSRIQFSRLTMICCLAQEHGGLFIGCENDGCGSKVTCLPRTVLNKFKQKHTWRVSEIPCSVNLHRGAIAGLCSIKFRLQGPSRNFCEPTNKRSNILSIQGPVGRLAHIKVNIHTEP